jgi:hypothetical protein
MDAAGPLAIRAWIEASAEEWGVFATVDRDRGDSLLALSWIPDAPLAWGSALAAQQLARGHVRDVRAGRPAGPHPRASRRVSFVNRRAMRTNFPIGQPVLSSIQRVTARGASQ